MIKKLSVRNFKGFTEKQVEFGPVNLIVGDNFSGKTAVSTAIRLALTGYLPPPIGKAPQSVYAALATKKGSPMEVALDVGGRQVAARWEQDMKGKVSTDHALPADLRMPDLLCDPRMFFAQTSTERMQTIARACPGAKLDVDGMEKAFRTVEAFPVSIREELVVEMVEQLKEAEGRQSALVPAWESRAREAKKGADAAAKALSPGKVSVSGRDQSPEIAKVQDEIDTKRRKHTAMVRELGKFPEHDVVALLTEERTRVDAFLATPSVKDPGPEPGTVPVLDELDIAKQRDHWASIAEWIESRDLKVGDDCPCCARKLTKGALVSVGEVMAAAKQLAEEADKSLAKPAEEPNSDWRDAADAFEVDQQKRKSAEKFLASFGQLVAEAKAKQDEKAKLEAEVSALGSEIMDLERRLTGLSAAQGEWEAGQRMLRESAKAESDVLRLRCEADVCAGAAKLLKAALVNVQDAAASSILEVCNRITDGLLSGPLGFREGQFGMMPEGTEIWVPWVSFSGTEETVAFAAMAMALAKDAPVKLVVMDELGRLEKERKAALLRRMVEAVKAGWIDQFIGIDVSEVRLTGVTVISL